MYISVIIPTYKPEEYIGQCLQSLESQTLDKESFEVLIILNGEKEPYYSNIQQLLAAYTFNGRLFYTDVAGVSNARNVGLDNAIGNYICFIDDDDYISPTYLENMFSLSVADSGTIIVSNVRTFVDNNKAFGKDYISYAFDKYSSIQTNSIFKKRKFLSSSCCKLIPKEIIGNTRFNTNRYLGEDALFMFEISANIQNIVLSADSTIYYRRLRSNSASRKRQPLHKKICNRLIAIKDIVYVYMRNIPKHNFLLFISRIIANLK